MKFQTLMKGEEEEDEEEGNVLLHGHALSPLATPPFDKLIGLVGQCHRSSYDPERAVRGPPPPDPCEKDTS
ncbi:unnamed protein product [Boreogadus saida]